MKFYHVLLTVLCTASIADARMHVSPQYINFGDVAVNSTSYKRARIQNIGQQDIKIDIYNRCFEDVRINNDCHFNLRPGRTCYLNLIYKPKRARNMSCQIDIRDSDMDWDRVSLSGRSIEIR